MPNQPLIPGDAEPSWTSHGLVRAALVLGLLYFFLVGVSGLGSGFKALGSGVVESFFLATENPFIALMVGILATTLVQSSSATTATIVALVAAPENPLPISNAVPMIMGANIGTTVTNTIAALAHLSRKEEFRRAFEVATCHDFFNYLTVLVLLPLELTTGFLEKSATALTASLGRLGGGEFESPIENVIKGGSAVVRDVVGGVIPSERLASLLFILVSAGLIFATLLGIVRVMRSSMQARVEALVNRALGKSGMLAILVGIMTTVMVQSSSITTSLLVPLAGAGVITLSQAFPVTLGANIGTTVTALIAAMGASGGGAAAGLTIALVHLLFNLSGTLLIYPFPRIRALPLMAASRLADVAVRSKTLAIAYVVALFYMVPALFAYLNRG